MEILEQPPAGLSRMVPIDYYYKMPPVGITQAYGRIGERVVINYDVRCGHRECWFVGHATDEAGAQTMLTQHAKDCPSPPARGQLPTGLSTLEKMWDELDAVTEAITDQKYYRVGDQVMDGMQLRGYARGICFTLAMMTFPHFRTPTDVVREAAHRYKIRKGTVPYRPTPTYRHNPVERPATPPVGTRSANHGTTKPAAAAPTTARKASAATLAAAKKVDLSSIDDKKRTQIMNGAASGMFTYEDLAVMYDVTPETIKVIVDGKPS